jgi:hypothetical protein
MLRKTSLITLAFALVCTATGAGAGSEVWIESSNGQGTVTRYDFSGNVVI